MKTQLVLMLFFAAFIAKAQEVNVPADSTGNTKNHPSELPQQKPLFILDGLPITNMDSISPDKIESIDVIRGQKAIDLYGEKGKHGVVVIHLKGSKKRPR